LKALSITARTTQTLRVYLLPLLSRFVSADSIVPNGEKASVIPLTVSFSEPMFLAGVAEENAFTLNYGFWLQLSGKQKEKAKLPWGPQNPQALNRYVYVLNNPLKYNDPTGHETCGDRYVGCEKHEIEGRVVWELWFDNQTIFVEQTELTDDLITNFKMYANAQRDAHAAITSAFLDMIGNTAAGTVAAAIAVLSPGTGPAAPWVFRLAVAGAALEYINAFRSIKTMGDMKTNFHNARADAKDYWLKLLGFNLYPSPIPRSTP